MREDDNVFDVSFEGMGTEEATASATDVKVVCVCGGGGELCVWFLGAGDFSKQEAGDFSYCQCITLFQTFPSDTLCSTISLLLCTHH